MAEMLSGSPPRHRRGRIEQEVHFPPVSAGRDGRVEDAGDGQLRGGRTAGPRPQQRMGEPTDPTPRWGVRGYDGNAFGAEVDRPRRAIHAHSSAQLLLVGRRTPTRARGSQTT